MAVPAPAVRNTWSRSAYPRCRNRNRGRSRYRYAESGSADEPRDCGQFSIDFDIDPDSDADPEGKFEPPDARASQLRCLQERREGTSRRSRAEILRRDDDNSAFAHMISSTVLLRVKADDRLFRQVNVPVDDRVADL